MLVLLAALTFAPLTAVARDIEPVPIDAAAAKSNNDFAWAMYDEIRDSDENIFFSATSIQTAFGMAYAGAREETATELETSLKMAVTGEDYHQAMSSMVEGFNAHDRPYELQLVNRLWCQSDLSFEPDYLDITDRFYEANVARLNFKKKPEPSRQTINRWVEEQTNDRIKDLLPQGSIKPLTAAVITNAIYFKGDWRSPFDEANTRDERFDAAGRGQVEVPLMHQTAQFAYGKAQGAQVLAMPYAGDELSMVVVLPKKGTNLRKLDVSTEMWDEWVSATRAQTVEVWYPTFEMDWGGSIKDDLKALGMERSFSDYADFTGMFGPKNPVKIDDVIHKAFVAVDEEGTEAAAATAIIMVGVTSVSKPAPIPVFRADRPFLFAIRHNVSGALLFVGRMMDPSQAQG